MKPRKGISYINYFNNTDIIQMNNNFACYSTFEKISICDAVILCLPTPIKNRSPEMKYINNSMKLIKKFLKIIKFFHWRALLTLGHLKKLYYHI